VAASVALPIAADGKAIATNLTRLILVNKGKLPNAPDLSDSDEDDPEDD